MDEADQPGRDEVLSDIEVSQVGAVTILEDEEETVDTEREEVERISAGYGRDASSPVSIDLAASDESLENETSNLQNPQRVPFEIESTVSPFRNPEDAALDGGRSLPPSTIQRECGCHARKKKLFLFAVIVAVLVIILSVIFSTSNKTGKSEEEGLKIRCGEEDGAEGPWFLLCSVSGRREDESTGSAVAISSDGSVLAVGSPGAYSEEDSFGRVSVYKIENRSMIQRGSDIKGVSKYMRVGDSVSLSHDGKIVAVRYRYRQVRVFEYDDDRDKWDQRGGDIIAEAYIYSDFVVLSSSGNFVAFGVKTYGNGDLDTISIQVFEYGEDREWNQRGHDIRVDEYEFVFPRDLSIYLSPGGSTVAFGCNSWRQKSNGEWETHRGIVAVYDFDETTLDWQQRGGNLIDDKEIDHYARYKVSMPSDGSTVRIQRGMSIEGVYYFRMLEFEFNEDGTGLDSSSEFGRWSQKGGDLEASGWTTASQSENGNVVAVHDYNGVSVYEYDEDNIWFQQGPTIPRWYSSLALSGDGSILVIANYIARDEDTDIIVGGVFVYAFDDKEG